MELTEVLKGALPPIVAALLFVTLGGVRLLPLAMAVGLFVAHVLLKGWPDLPHELWEEPHGGTWLVWGVIACALVSAGPSASHAVGFTVKDSSAYVPSKIAMVAGETGVIVTGLSSAPPLALEPQPRAHANVDRQTTLLRRSPPVIMLAA